MFQGRLDRFFREAEARAREQGGAALSAAVAGGIGSRRGQRPGDARGGALELGGMRMEVRRFGDILSSRPAGREAFLVARAYSRPVTASEPIELDFTGVKVLTPSWADEFISGLKEHYGKERVVCLRSSNPSVVASLDALAED